MNEVLKLASKGSHKLRIVFLGPDGAGKSSVIYGLIDRWDLGGRTVKLCHLKPQLMMPQLRDNPNSIDTDPHGKSPRGVFLSLAKIGIWLVEEWYVSFFRVKKGTVLIYDRYYHDLLVDPKRYRFGAPLWIARLVGKLMPRPDLWILMLAPAEVLQARKQEVSLAESELECRTYLAFVRKQRKYVIVDASQPLDKVIADAEHAIRAAVLNGDNRG